MAAVLEVAGYLEVEVPGAGRSWVNEPGFLPLWRLGRAEPSLARPQDHSVMRERR